MNSDQTLILAAHLTWLRGIADAMQDKKPHLASALRGRGRELAKDMHDASHPLDEKGTVNVG